MFPHYEHPYTSQVALTLHEIFACLFVFVCMEHEKPISNNWNELVHFTLRTAGISHVMKGNTSTRLSSYLQKYHQPALQKLSTKKNRKLTPTDSNKKVYLQTTPTEHTRNPTQAANFTFINVRIPSGQWVESEDSEVEKETKSSSAECTSSSQLLKQ